MNINYQRKLTKACEPSEAFGQLRELSRASSSFSSSHNFGKDDWLKGYDWKDCTEENVYGETFGKHDKSLKNSFESLQISIESTLFQPRNEIKLLKILRKAVKNH